MNEDFVHITELLLMRITKNCCDDLSEGEPRRKQPSQIAALIDANDPVAPLLGLEQRQR